MSEENQDIDLPPAKKQKLDSEHHEEGKQVDSPPLQEERRDKDSTLNEDKYTNFVTAEEVEKLREFKVLDEVKSNDEDSNDDSDSSDGKSEGIPEDEIDKMLEEDLPDGFKGAPKPKEKTYVTRQKIVLEEKVVDQFEVLPLDWMMVHHYSGMPVYMHRNTRVCTLSKPYFLGKGNTRRHEIPISAIPCYAYRRALEEEEKQKEIDRRIAEQIRTGSWRKNYNANNNQNANKTTDNNNANSQNNPGTSNENNEAVVEIDKGNNDNVHGANNEINNSNSNGNNNVIDAEGIVESCNGNNDVINVESGNGNNNIVNVEDIDGNGNNNVIDLENGDGNNTVINVENNDNVPVNSNENNAEGNNVEMDLKTGTQESTDNKNNTESNQSNDTQGKCPFNHGSGTERGKPEVEIPLNLQPVVLPGGIVMPPPKVETVNTSWKSQHLAPEQVNDYCKKLFKFKTVNIMLFERWADRRKYTKARKALQYPTLPEGTKLITIPANPNATSENGGSKVMKRDWVMNMDGRSYLSVFHEYVRRALQKQPVYEFKQLENAATPYQATVYIGGMQYGVGHGSSKRQAKSAAARASVHILIPEMKDELDAHIAHAPAPAPNNEPDFTFFDYVGIEDPRIAEFCAAACEPSPHAILRTCLLRNFGAGDWHIHTEMKKLEYQKIELTMKVGKHSATVVCKNKKTAKQRASQAILQALHPLVRSWGSLLRLYGLRSVKSCKEKKIEEQEITLLQDKARQNEPNYAVLDKLRDEMRKLRERDEAVVPIGTLLLTDDLPTHSASNLNNIDL